MTPLFERLNILKPTSRSNDSTLWLNVDWLMKRAFAAYPKLPQRHASRTQRTCELSMRNPPRLPGRPFSVLEV